MNGSARYSLALCVFALGLEGCGADADGGSSSAGVDTDVEAKEAPMDLAWGESSFEAEPTAAREEREEREEHEGAQSCACGSPFPGIEITEDDDRLTVTLDVPGAAAVTLDLTGGDCVETKQGLELSGDVDVDLGGVATVQLLDADLAVVTTPGQTGVSIAGMADLSPSWLGEALSLATLNDARAGVALELGANEAPPELALLLPRIGLDASALPLAGAPLELANTTIVVSTSGDDQQLEIRGRLNTDAGMPWLSQVPLTLMGNADVSASIVDQSFKNLILYSDAQLDGDSLLCGATRLLPLALPDATVTWDPTGIEVRARTEGDLLPALSLLGGADITASFAESGWGITVCDDLLLGLGSVLEGLECIDLSPSGLSPRRR